MGIYEVRKREDMGDRRQKSFGGTEGKGIGYRAQAEGRDPFELVRTFPFQGIGEVDE